MDNKLMKKIMSILPGILFSNFLLIILGVIFLYAGTVAFSFFGKIFSSNELSKDTTIQIINKVIIANADILAIISLTVLGGLIFLTGKILHKYENIGKKLVDTGYSTVTGLLYVISIICAMLFLLSFNHAIENYSHIELFLLFLGYFGLWQLVEVVVKIN